MVDTQVLEIAHRCGYFANNFQGSDNTDQEKNREFEGEISLILLQVWCIYVHQIPAQFYCIFRINILSMIVIISILI